MSPLADNRPLSEVYLEIGNQWADTNAAASLLEDCKSAFLAQKVAMMGDMPVNRAENVVKSSDEWEEYIHKMVDTRKQANKLRVKLDSIKMAHSEKQSEEATE